MNADSSPHLPNRPRGRLARALFSALLAVCPRDMRREYGTAILGDFDDRYAAASERGASHASRFAVYALFDLVGSGLLERFEAFGRDVSYAVRGAARAPVFATVVVLTMAIAIALNATVFATISAIFLQPLPMRDAGSLLVLWETNPHIGMMTEAFTYPDLEALRRETRTLASVGAIMTDPAVLDGAGAPRELNGYFASPDMFGIYKTRVVLGRSLTAADVHDGAPFVIVISNELWHSAFGADPHVVGRFIRISDYRAEIIGVAEPHVVEIDGWRGGLARPDFWGALKPVVWREQGHLLRVVARAKLGVTHAAVDADLARIFTTLAVAHPADDAGLSAHALTARDALVGDERPIFLVIAVAMLAVLIVACANVGNLFLSRASARTGEFAVRFSLGAARGRIVAQLLTEVGLYVSVGGLLGLIFTVYATRAVAMLLPGLTRIDGYGIDPPVLAFTAFVIVVATLLAGLAPANALGRPDLSASLKASGRGADLTRGRKVRATLAIVEIALAVAITTAAGLNVRSLQALTQRTLGYDTTNLWLVHAGAHYMKRYATLAGQLTLYRHVSHELITTPGIAAASWSSITPFNSTPDVPFTIAGRSYGAGTKPDVDFGPVDAAYFSTFRIHTLAGRTFDASDRESSAPTVVVNAAFARRYFGGVPAALGKRITVEITGFGQAIVPRTIVGVVADVRQTYDHNAGPIAYLPLAQQSFGSESLVVRATSPHVDVPAIVRSVVARVDALLPPPTAVPYAELMSADVGRQRTAATLLAVSAAIAFVLALAGIYAVVSFGAVRRTNEFGVRLSLGARPFAIARLVLADAARILAIGLAAGVVLAAGIANMLEPQLFDVPALDVPTFAAVIVTLIVAVALATLVPVVRAVRVDPAVALRYE